MAITKNANSYVDGRNYLDVVSTTQTNRFAEPENAVKLYGIEVYGDRPAVEFTANAAVDGATITFTPAAGNDANTDFYKFVIIDKSGNEATAPAFNPASPNAALVANTSGLNEADDWEVIFSTSNNDGATKICFRFCFSSSQIVAGSEIAISYPL